MLSSVLRSKRAIQVNVEIMRTFVRFRQILSENKSLEKHLIELEKKYDKQFSIVFDAIKQLMLPENDKTKNPIGFVWQKEKGKK
ncbi:Conserved domain protein [uncultured Candidatus Thioglobus sp.]|nr:Conserved domain protein [uncultured Candidatus Thioglobus sp.]